MYQILCHLQAEYLLPSGWLAELGDVPGGELGEGKDSTEVLASEILEYMSEHEDDVTREDR